jgi:biopolymer transport protein ExbD
MSRRVILWYLLGAVVVAASSHPALSQETPSTTGAATSADTTVVVYVPRDGEFYVGKDRVAQAEIPDRLRVAFKDTPPEGRMVHISAGLDVSYKTVVSVIDTIRGAGFSQIGLVTDADSGSKPRAKSPKGGAGKGKKVRGRRHAHRRAGR